MGWRQPPQAGEGRFDVPMPPHCATVRVIHRLGKARKVEVAGFAPFTPSKYDPQMMFTERQMKREDPPLREVALAVRPSGTAAP